MSRPPNTPPAVAQPPVAPSPRSRRVDLIAFDVDGTLVEHDRKQVVWQVLNRRLGRGDGINRERFLRYLAGEISYREWVDLDVGDWCASGATRALIEEAVREELRLVDGAREVVHQLKARGYRLAVVSGTLDVTLDVLFPDHPFDEVFTNRICFADDGSIASWQATPYDLEGKAEALRLLCAAEGVPIERCAFVGDNVNDLPALRICGLPVAYDPKTEEVRDAAQVVLAHGELRRLLSALE